MNFLMQSPFYSLTTPAKKEKQRRRRDDYCKLCKKMITKEGMTGSGPGRHVLWFHMDTPKFFCPHCEFSSKYDKARVFGHMKHSEIGGDIRLAEDAVFKEKFNNARQCCFGPVKHVNTVTVSPR